MEFTLANVLAIVSPLVAVGLSYGGIRVSVRSLEKSLEEIVKKQDELEKGKAPASVESKVASTETKVSAQEATLRELERRHTEGVTEMRNRASALEARASSLEQGSAEQRAQLNSLMQGLSRVEAKQDREAETLQEIRRDVLDFVVNKSQPARTSRRKD